MIMALIYRNVPRKKASELLLLGERIDAREAERLGHRQPRGRADAEFDAAVADWAAKLAAQVARCSCGWARTRCGASRTSRSMDALELPARTT